MQALARVTKATTPAQVAERIIQAIRRGELAPGQRLPAEPELGAVFGVGRNSLREAIRFLELAGVLDVRPGEGTFVAADDTRQLAQAISLQVRLTPRSAAQVIESRSVLEQAAAGFAAERATDDDLAKLRDAVRRMQEAEDVEAFVQADLRFHDGIAEASHNIIMRHMIQTLRTSIGEWIQQLAHLPDSRRACYEEHVLVLQAIGDHDAAGARAAMTAHLADVGQRLIRVMGVAEDDA